MRFNQIWLKKYFQQLKMLNSVWQVRMLALGFISVAWYIVLVFVARCVSSESKNFWNKEQYLIGVYHGLSQLMIRHFDCLFLWITLHLLVANILFANRLQDAKLYCLDGFYYWLKHVCSKWKGLWTSGNITRPNKSWIRVGLDSVLKGLTKENTVLGEKVQMIAEEFRSRNDLSLSAIFSFWVFTSWALALFLWGFGFYFHKVSKAPSSQGGKSPNSIISSCEGKLYPEIE